MQSKNKRKNGTQTSLFIHLIIQCGILPLIILLCFIFFAALRKTPLYFPLFRDLSPKIEQLLFRIFVICECFSARCVPSSTTKMNRQATSIQLKEYCVCT